MIRPPIKWLTESLSWYQNYDRWWERVKLLWGIPRWFFWYYIFRAMVRRRIKEGMNPQYAHIFLHEEDPTPLVCTLCLWTGPERKAVLVYRGGDENDIEADYVCPNCENSL